MKKLGIVGNSFLVGNWKHFNLKLNFFTVTVKQKEALIESFPTFKRIQTGTIPLSQENIEKMKETTYGEDNIQKIVQYIMQTHSY